MPEEDQSEHPILKRKEFVNKTPEHLLAGCDENTKYILHSQNIMDQKLDWLIDAVINTNEQVRKTNGKVIHLQEFKSNMESSVKRIEEVGCAAGVKRCLDQAETVEALKDLQVWKKDVAEKKFKTVDSLNELRLKFTGFWLVVLAALLFLSSVGSIIAAVKTIF